MVLGLYGRMNEPTRHLSDIVIIAAERAETFLFLLRPQLRKCSRKGSNLFCRAFIRDVSAENENAFNVSFRASFDARLKNTRPHL